MFYPIVSGILLSLINFIMAILIIRYSFNKEYQKFNNMIYGSMIIRLLLIISIYGVIIVKTSFDIFTFTLSFFSGIFIFNLIEIYFVSKLTYSLKTF